MENYEKRMRKIKQYKATLIGIDGFIKEMVIRYPMPQIFIPEKQIINVFLESPEILARPVNNYRIFSLDSEKSYKNKLIYKELSN